MRTESEKAAEELSVFYSFNSSKNFPFDIIENRNPPEPDILCSDIHGSKIAFELVEICDSNIAKEHTRLFKNAINGEFEDNTFIRTSDPTPEIIEKKLNKRYKTPHQIELLCYWNNRVVSPPSFIIERITSIIDTTTIQHQFHKVWFLSGIDVTLIWSRR